MKTHIVSLIVGLACLNWIGGSGVHAAEDATRAFVENNRDSMIATLNGEQFKKALWKKLASPQSEYGAIFGDAQNYLSDHEIVLSGALKSSSESKWGLFATAAIKKLGLPEDWVKLVSAQHTLVLTIGQHCQQPVNIVCKIDGEANKPFPAMEGGQAVVVCGKVANSWGLSDEVALIDARLVDRSEFEKATHALPVARQLLEWNYLLLPEPYSSLGEDERIRLARMSKLANLAYPATELPKGVRAYSVEEWKKVSDGKIADEIYTPDGYFVLGDGLRGRLMKWGETAIVSLSGCDLSGANLDAGLTDLITATRHIMEGRVVDQFKLANSICKGVMRTHSGPVWIVGHSLGGGLVTYVATQLGGDPRVNFATFNGLGMSEKLLCQDGDLRNIKQICSSIVNIYSDRDPVYAGHRLIPLSGMKPRHLGRSYFLEYRNPATSGTRESGPEEKIKWDDLGGLKETMRLLGQAWEKLKVRTNDMVADALYYHGMVVLADEIAKASPPCSFEGGYATLICLVSGLLLVLMALLVFSLHRKWRK